MPENIIQRAIRKIRPGSGGPAEAISIIDGITGRAPSFNPGIRSVPDSDEDFDDQKSGMPLALGVSVDSGPQYTSTPVGRLPGVDKDGNIPFYEPDDPAVLYRIFGQRIPSDD